VPLSTGLPNIPPDPTPTVAVQVAFTNDPLDPAPTWTTVATAEQVTTRRGGAYQQAQAQAGTATIEIDNAVPNGATGAPYTPGNAAGLLPTPDRPVRVQVTPPAPYNGTTYTIHTGNADAWETRLDAAGLDYSRATVKSVDGFLALAGITLRSTLAQEILADNPVGYFPLGEQAGSPSAGSLAGTGGLLGQNAQLGYNGLGGGAAAFGGAVLAPSDPATALALGPTYNGVNGVGGAPLALPSQALLSVAGGFTVQCVFSAVAVTPNHSQGGALLAATYSDLGLFYQLTLNDDGTIFLVVYAPGFSSSNLYAQSPLGSALGYTDGKPHLVHATVGADQTTISLYVDGVRVASSSAGPALPVGAASKAWAGFVKGAPPYSTLYFDGQLAHVALYQYPLSAARVAAQYQAFLGFPGDLSGARVGRILDYAGEINDAAHRKLDPGRSALGPALLTGQSALTSVQDATASEQGLFFKDGSGRSVFQDRGHRQNAVSKVTLNIADDSLPVEPDIIFQLDRTFIRNDITGSRPGGAVQRVQDATSQRQHRRITEPSPLTINLPDDDAVLNALQWRLFHLKQPAVRIPQCSIKPVTSPALWPWALGLEVGDQITLANLPPTAPAATMNVVIDAIEFPRSNADEWVVTFLLSPAEPSQYLRADGAPSAHTKLDSGLKIGW